MTMFFKPYYLGCLSHASYLIGDAGTAAVIDPRRDVEEYLADAATAGLRIAHVIETHLHADFVSGHVELARRTGATIYLGGDSGATFPHHAARDGETIPLGDLTLRFLATPGHTPEGVTILAEENGAPRKAFTGDTLFIGDVGRPDLAGGGAGLTAEQMARTLFATLRGRILPLPDDVEVWPAHGAGSACGKALSAERVSTIGRQRTENFALRLVADGDEEGFVRYTTEGLDAAPRYFAHDAARNRAGGASLEEIQAAARPLSPSVVEQSQDDRTLVLDTRSPAAFGAGHLPGALHVPLEGRFAPWVGAVVPPEARLIVVAEPGQEVEAITRLARVGYENVVGWLEGGIDAWRADGGKTQTVSQMTPDDLRTALAAPNPPQVLDVRSRAEWEEGHLPGAIPLPLPQLAARLTGLPVVPDDAPLVVICGSGYRSSIACSLLQRAGRSAVTNVTGGWAAWQESLPAA